MVHQRVSAGLLVSGLLTTLLTVSACGGNDKPAVCSDADALKSSVSALTDIKLEQGALSTLQTKLTDVQNSYEQLKTDAKSQFGTQLSAVDSAATALKASLETASADTSAANLAAVGLDLKTMASAVSSLESAVQDTC